VRRRDLVVLTHDDDIATEGVSYRGPHHLLRVVLFVLVAGIGRSTDSEGTNCGRSSPVSLLLLLLSPGSSLSRGRVIWEEGEATETDDVVPRRDDDDDDDEAKSCY